MKTAVETNAVDAKQGASRLGRTLQAKREERMLAKAEEIRARRAEIEPADDGA